MNFWSIKDFYNQNHIISLSNKCVELFFDLNKINCISYYQSHFRYLNKSFIL